MSLGSLCRRNIVIVKSGTMVIDVAQIMEERNVGCVVVNGTRDVFGIVTDRDILLRVVNKNLDPSQTPIDDVMTKEPVITFSEDMELFDVLEEVRKSAFRRYPVADSDGNLVGLITLDDIIVLIGKEMADVANIIENEGPLL